MTCMKQEFCIHEKYCQRHIGQNFDSCLLFSRNSKPMTNEEWLKSLSTEELANYIATQCADAIRLWREMQYWTAHEKCKSNKWYVWLKEIHE